MRGGATLLCRCKRSFNAAISQLDNASRTQAASSKRIRQREGEGASGGRRVVRATPALVVAASSQLNNKLQQV